MAGGLTYYISEVNSATSVKYNISSLRNQITHLSEQQNLLTAKKSATENPVAALMFAQSQNMVEAKDIVYIFENGNVALHK